MPQADHRLQDCKSCMLALYNSPLSAEQLGVLLNWESCPPLFSIIFLCWTEHFGSFIENFNFSERKLCLCLLQMLHFSKSSSLLGNYPWFHLWLVHLATNTAEYISRPSFLRRPNVILATHLPICPSVHPSIHLFPILWCNWTLPR